MDDEYNSEFSRVFFGPLKTPERALVAASNLQRSPHQDLDDLEHLVLNESDDDHARTPHLDRYSPDEPSSALADKVIHAVDNPSPPPSPPPLLSFFDPYHATKSKSNISTDYHNDLLSLKFNHDVEPSPFQKDLISFDSPSSSPLLQNVPTASHVFPSVDDLLSQSPISPRSTPPNNSSFARESIEQLLPLDVQTSPDKVILNLVPQLTPTLQEESSRPNRTNDLLTTPLRRSTRPRKSITPNPPLNVTPPPSIAKTQIRRKAVTINPDQEVVSDSQDETEDVRLAFTPTTIRERRRSRSRSLSPEKTVLSFQRELGSLSPTSTDVLATLAFAADEPSSNLTPSPIPDQFSSTSQLPLSFSVFASETTATSTPRGAPLRVPGSPRRTTSPDKFRIQSKPNDPSNTPARRIPIADALLQGHISPQKAIQFRYKPDGTPLAGSPPKRVRVSNDTSKASSSKVRSDSPSKVLSLRSIESSTRTVTSIKGKEKASFSKLPYPLVPSPTKPEVTDSKPSPAKSSLKQVTGSRIPRIGVKPYARPNGKSRLVATVELPKPPPKPVIGGSRTATKKTNGAPESAQTAEGSRLSTSMSLLKRKRDIEQPSPTKLRTTSMRQVASLSVKQNELSSSKQPSAAPSFSSKNAKIPQGPLRIRRVMDSEPNNIVPSTPPQPDLQDLPTVVYNPPRPVEHPSMDVQPLLEPGLNPEGLAISLPPNQDPNQLEPKHANPSAVIRTDLSSASESAMSGLRRTTRSRKTATLQDTSLVEGSSRPITSRRRTAVLTDDVFSGMSINALKDLTTSNTVRNQGYLAAKLETEVVRKEGVRPESPLVKVRTILQRQQEDKEKERAERAERRARRSDGMTSSDIEGPSDAGYSSPCDQPSRTDPGPSTGHRRGAGEDEDYITPERLGQVKRFRLFEDIDDVDQEREKRRVKWDQGLFTTVFIDEVKLGTRQTLKENRSLKGILAPAAKALRLDTLGNLPCDLPLTDLVQENIVVKKIVYDSDTLEPEVTVTKVTKNVRSKSKKK